MSYRNKTYVIFDGDNDMWAYAYMKGWKESEHRQNTQSATRTPGEQALQRFGLRPTWSLNMDSSTPISGAWIFVPHSRHDLEKVRRIRNELERRGRNPLLFFLKCLAADAARLPELICDEIKARTFFVLCNTRASRRSK